MDNGETFDARQDQQITKKRLFSMNFRLKISASAFEKKIQIFLRRMKLLRRKSYRIPI